MPATGAPPQTARIQALDGWRGISILLVVVGHLLQFRYGTGSPDDLGYRLADAFSTSGVCLFFTISGFIIMSLAMKERESARGFSARAFYVRRFFRIVPPLYFYLGVVLICGLAGRIVQTTTQTLHGAAFICNVNSVPCGWFAGHTWSLAYEEQFYVLFPLLLLPMLPLARKAMTVVCALLLALPLIWYEMRLGRGWLETLHMSYYASFICLGVLLALHRDRLQQFCRRPGSTATVWIALAVFLSCAIIIALAQGPGAARRLVQARIILVAVLAPLSATWLIGSSLYIANRYTQLLETRWLCFIGAISYSLYLWQEFFSAPPYLYRVSSLFFAPPLMFGCALLSYLYIERPCIRLGKDIAARVRGAAPRGPSMRSPMLGTPRPL
jgi:peptidoglycan/LPS O-acetylase OafA/YrhL